LICTRCYYRKECRRKPDGDGRCRYYLKKGTVRLDNDFEMDVNPMETGAADVRDMGKIVGR